LLELQNIEKFSVDLLLASDSIKHALGKVSNLMVELHMTFVPVDFIIMDMGNKNSSPTILGRPFCCTTGAIIDSKEGNVKFQFPHKMIRGCPIFIVSRCRWMITWWIICETHMNSLVVPPLPM
jgi:hypothetical protein